jgi:hypothetical protein
MKKYVRISLLLGAIAPSLVHASLTNTERAIKINSTHLNNVAKRKGIHSWLDLPEGNQEYIETSNSTAWPIRTATEELFCILLSTSYQPSRVSMVENALQEGADPNGLLLCHHSYNPLKILWMTPSMLAAKIKSPDIVRVLQLLTTAGADTTLPATAPLQQAPTEITALLLAQQSQNTAAENYLRGFTTYSDHPER